MKIGAIKETKVHEYRASLIPSSVIELVQHGHTVFIQKGLGEAIGFSDNDYKNVGATIVDTVEELFQKSELLVKVKEPTLDECLLLTKSHTIFTYLHLAALPEQTKLLKESKSTAIAYETVTDNNGRLPLLAPMSEVAGRLSILSGCQFLLKSNNGSGVLLNGVPGVAQGNVCVIGAGVVGSNAIATAIGIGAKVVALDRNMNSLRQLDALYGNKITTLYSSKDAIAKSVAEADIVVGAALIPGAKATKLVTKEMLKTMKKGSVLVDVSIDQGGCFETSKPTSYDNPVFEVDGIIHYCVANMPGGVAKTSTIALNNATIPFIVELANKGISKALAENTHLKNGLNVYNGKIVHKQLAESIGEPFVSVDFN